MVCTLGNELLHSLHQIVRAMRYRHLAAKHHRLLWVRKGVDVSAYTCCIGQGQSCVYRLLGALCEFSFYSQRGPSRNLAHSRSSLSMSSSTVLVSWKEIPKIVLLLLQYFPHNCDLQQSLQHVYISVTAPACCFSHEPVIAINTFKYWSSSCG